MKRGDSPCNRSSVEIHSSNQYVNKYKMKFILLSLLAVLSSFSCSSGNSLSDSNIKIKTQFSDLNDDVFYIIFNYLECEDFLNLVQINSTLSDIATNVFRYKYRLHQLKITAGNTFLAARILQQFEDGQHQLAISNIPLAMNVLKSFGSIFQSVKFSYEWLTKNIYVNQMTQYIGEYCSKSVKQFDLDMRHDLLEKITAPFEAVKELTIRSRVSSFNNSIRLNDLFPQLRRLNLVSVDASNYSFLNDEFPNLVHFSFRSCGSDDIPNNKNIRELILRNPTIRSIEPQVRDTTLLQFINQQLPNLENLTIFNLAFDAIQFDSVKNLEIATGNIDSIAKLSVPRIESLKMVYRSIHSHKWMAFFKNHTQLRRLHIREMHRVHVSQPLRNVDEFTADLLNLTDFTIDSFQYVVQDQIDSIVAFFAKHSKLKRCSFLEAEFSADRQRTLRERLGNEWETEFKEFDGFFQRKLPKILE